MKAFFGRLVFSVFFTSCDILPYWAPSLLTFPNVENLENCNAEGGVVRGFLCNVELTAVFKIWGLGFGFEVWAWGLGFRVGRRGREQLRVLAFKNKTKIPREDLPEREERMKVAGEEKKKTSEIFCSPPFGAPPFKALDLKGSWRRRVKDSDNDAQHQNLCS